MEEQTESVENDDRGVEMVLVMDSAPVLNENKSHNRRTAVDKLHKQILNTWYCDDYEKFCKLLRNKKARFFLFQRDFDGQSLFDEILEDEKVTSAKYVSLVLIHFDLKEDEFVENAETWLTLVNKADSVANLLSLLIPDWYQPQPKTFHFLPLKAVCFDNTSGRSLCSKLFSIIDDENSFFFHDACFRTICQLLHELSFENDDDEYEYVVDRSTLVEAAAMINEEFRDQIVQVLLVHLLPTDVEEIESCQNLMQPVFKSRETKKPLQLMFNLFKNEIHQFQTPFVGFVNEAKSTYGDYFTFLVKPYTRLLLMIAKQKEMHNTQAFIHKTFPPVGSNPSFMTSIYETQEYRNFIIKPFENQKINQMYKSYQHIDSDKDDRTFFEELEKLIGYHDFGKEKETTELKLLVFGRDIQRQGQKTIFERILSTNIPVESLLETLFDKLKLRTNPEFLKMKSSDGRQIVELIVDSDSENFLTFLMSKHGPASFKSYNLQYINHQLVTLKGKSLFEFCLEINARDVYSNPEKELSFEFSSIIFCLLEELKRITDIDKQVHLQQILDRSAELEEQNDDQASKESKKMRFYQDDLLGMVVAYWSRDDPNYGRFKNILKERNIFFAMLFDILDGNEEKFALEFMQNIEKFEALCPKQYGSVDSSPNLATNMTFIFLMAALLNDRRKVIDRIFEYEEFISIKIKFPPNIRCNDTCHYVATKLLENGFELRHKEIPENWITPGIFKQFLDERVSLHGDTLEIDFGFLVHANTRAYEIKGSKDVDAKLLLFEDWKALEYIYENESLRHLFAHPVLSTYVDLKSMKHSRIKNVFWGSLFVLFLALIYLTVSLTLKIKNSEETNWLFPVPILVLSIFIIFCLSRISPEIFSHKSNWFLGIGLLGLVVISFVTFKAPAMVVPLIPIFITILACVVAFVVSLFNFTTYTPATSKNLASQSLKARSFIVICKDVFNLYKTYSLFKKTKDEKNKFKKLLSCLLKRSLSEYPFIHKLDKLSVCVQTREVYISIDNERIPILSPDRSKKYERYLISEESLKLLWKIVEENKKKSSTYDSSTNESCIKNK